MENGNLTPCIYCRRNEVPRTREHVLQAAFGATATLVKEVCADCNNAFSAIDKSFLEGVQFYYTGENMLRRFGIGRASLDDGTSVNAVYRPDGSGAYPPQLYEVSPTEWKFLGQRESDFHAMLRELKHPTTFQLKTELVRADEGIPRLTIVRSAPNVYLVQGVDSEALERFASHLLANGLDPDWSDRTFRHSSDMCPPIKFDTSLSLDPFCRAMAKIALNFVCYRLGPDVALRQEFNAVRRYARFGEGRFDDFAVPTLLNHSLSESMAAFVSEKHHGLHLVTTNPKKGDREAVFIAIKGKMIGRADLTRGCRGLPQGTWLLTRFDVDRPAIENLTLPRDMLRALLNPNAIGLQDIRHPNLESE